MGYKRVGVEFPEYLWKEARKKCIDIDMSFAEYIRYLVKEDLEKQKGKEG